MNCTCGHADEAHRQLVPTKGFFRTDAFRQCLSFPWAAMFEPKCKCADYTPGGR